MLDLQLLRREFFRIPSRWASQSNSIFVDVGLEMLKDKDQSNLSRQKKQEVNAIAIGTIITALAYNDSKYFGHALSWISDDPKHKYYETLHYPLYWEKLCEACDIENLIKSGNYHDEQFKYFSKEHPVYSNMVTITGHKILKGELPFNKEQLMYLFPKLENFFNNIEKEIRKEYTTIESEFNQIANDNKNLGLCDEKKKLLVSVVKLKEHVLSQYDADNKHFDFDSCMLLAKHTKLLINKVVGNKATTSDIELFKKDTKPFLSGHSVTMNIILTYIVGLAVGIVAGLTAGALIGKNAGAVIGVNIGLKLGFVCATLGIWGIKKDPVKQFADDAKKLCGEDPQPTNIKAI